VQRLKTRAQFQAVLAGTTVSRTAHFALHRTSLDAQPPVPAKPGSGSEGRVHIQPTGPESEGRKALFAVQEAWVGALIPKRWAKRAVTRNAIKRQIYAVSTDLEAALPQAAHVVRLRSAFDRAKFPSASSDALKQAVRGELQQLFARAAR
jgi:ribonuclease P protein component